MKHFLQIDGLEHELRDHTNDVFTLTVDKPLVICAGSFTTILGPSGCGKTTLLTLLGLLRKPSNPKSITKFSMHGYDIADLWRSRNEREIERLRRQLIGFALQGGELLHALTVSGNIAVPMRLNGATSAKCEQRVEELLSAFGLADKAKERVNKISVGEYQRVVLARAIAHSPEIVFVDEPTSALDRENETKALTQLKELQSSSKQKTTVVMITHDDTLAEKFSNQIVYMEKTGSVGRITRIVGGVNG